MIVVAIPFFIDNVENMKKFHPMLLDAQQCAILLLRLIELRDENSAPVTRLRLSELTLRRLWGRTKLRGEFMEEVQEWLSRGGWCLFFAGNTYAAIRTSSVQGWVRLSSKKMADDLESINRGEFNFEEHYRLIVNAKGIDSDD